MMMQLRLALVKFLSRLVRAMAPTVPPKAQTTITIHPINGKIYTVNV